MTSEMSVQILLKLSPDLKEKVQEAANQEDVSVSEFIRSCLLERVTFGKGSPVEDMVSTLDNIGNKIDNLSKIQMNTLEAFTKHQERLVDAALTYMVSTEIELEQKVKTEEIEESSPYASIPELKVLGNRLVRLKVSNGWSLSKMEKAFGCTVTPMTRWRDGRLLIDEKVSRKRYRKLMALCEKHENDSDSD